MRLKLGIAAVSLSLAAAVLLTGCSGGGGGSTGGGNVPSPVPGGSTENPKPTQPDNPGGSGDKKDDSTDDPALNLYEPVDPRKIVRSFNEENFIFFIDVDTSTVAEESGRFAKFHGPYSHCTKGSSLSPSTFPYFRYCVDGIPEDYLKGEDGAVSNYVWDAVDKKIVHVKNSKGSSPIDSSKWEYRDGYKYICEIWGGNRIRIVRESLYKYNHNLNLESFDGWCKEEDVDELIKQLDAWPGGVVALDGCPFQENLKPDPHSSTSGYYLYNGRVYFEYKN